MKQNDQEEEILELQNSILKLDKMIQTKYNISQENLKLFEFLLEQTLNNVRRAQQPLPEICKYAECKTNITLNIRKNVRDEVIGELKNKTVLNLCLEDDFVNFMRIYCDISPGKSIQGSRLTRIYNNITGKDLTIKRIGIIIGYISKNYPITKKHKSNGIYYEGLDVKKEYLDNEDNVKL